MDATATDLAFAGLARQAELVRSREVSPRELVDLYLDRIERIDPKLGAFRVVLGERARAEAEQAEARVGDGEEPPLLGVPVAVKDNVDLAGEFTGYGSAGHGGPRTGDSEQVRRLRAAGAIVIGKTNLPELAIFPFTVSEANGKTRNPWNPDRSAGGSSGGSGSAVAAGLVPAASASDGGGSIRIPASCCGLVGLKPQRGRVSLMPDREHWNGLSVAGSVTRTVIDTALWLDAVAGPAEGDADRAEPPARPFAEAARSAPGKLRIAVSTRPPVPGVKVADSVKAAVAETAGVLRSLGHDVVERDPDRPELRTCFIPRWLRGIADDAAAMDDPERLERRTRRIAGLGRRIGDRGLRRARGREARIAQRINAIFDHCDVLLTPTITHPPEDVDRYDGRGFVPAIFTAANTTPFTIPWNTTGQPAMSVPAPSLDDGVPIGVQLVGRPSDEATLISLGAQLEAEVGWADRRPPVD
ncbi:MAG TPA: amidase [Thermoleophilaceae bacterium]|nr:amidase [Thermoleophilaceae bacterium]